MLGRQDPVTQIRWIGVNNVSGLTIPAFAAMRPTGVDTTTGLIQVNQPNADGQEVLFNGDVAIKAGLNGIGTRDFPAYALYETADGTPSVSDTSWGAGTGTWKLRKNKAGFKVYGGATAGRVKVVGAGGSASTVVPVRVAAAGAANALTAATVQSGVDGTPPTWAADGASCWAWDLNGGVVQIGRYQGLFFLTHSDNKAVYLVDSGFSGTIQVCEGDLAMHTVVIARGKIISNS